MNHIILDFLNAYKNLDALCKQILSSDIGVSKYIEEMEKEQQASYYITNWERDYKRLKHLRWVRNQLVHDTDSFEKKMVTSNDVEWLKRFRRRILSCSDPLSLLHKTRNQKKHNRKSYKKISKKRNKKIKGLLFVILIFLVILFLFVLNNT